MCTRRRAEREYFRGDIDLINEADLFGDLFTSVSGKMELHLLQQGVRFELSGVGHW